MALHAMYDSVDKITSNFVRVGYPYYAICDTKGEFLWTNESENNVALASEQLKEDLSSIRQGNTAIFTIKHFKEVPAKGLKKNTECDCISTFKNCFSEDQKQEYSGRQSYMFEKLMDKIDGLANENQEIKMKLALMEGDEEPEEQQAPSTAAGIMGALLSQPKIQDVLIGLITGFATNFLTNNMNTKETPQLAGIAGVQNESLELIIDRLISKGVTVDDLQKLSLMEQKQISLLLTMLRSN